MTSSPRSTGTKIRALIVSLLLVLGILFAASQAYRELASRQRPQDRKETAHPRATVQVLTAALKDHREVLRGYGPARPLKRTTVAAEVAGLIERIDPSLEPGSVVDSKVVLIEIATADLENAKANAEAVMAQHRASKQANVTLRDSLEQQKKEAVAERETVELELKRLQELSVRSRTQDELDSKSRVLRQVRRVEMELDHRLRATLDDDARLEALMQGAAAQVRRAQDDVKRASIRSPFPGVIEERLVGVRERVMPGTQLFRVMDSRRIEVAIALGGSGYSQIEVGRELRLRLREGGAVVWKGPVERIAPSIDDDRTFSVYAEVKYDESRAPIPPGAFLVGEVDGEIHKEVIALPRTAFLGALVFVAIPDALGSLEAKVVARTPTVKRFLPDLALVEAGVAPGEMVIVSHLDEMSEGARVRLPKSISGGETAGSENGR